MGSPKTPATPNDPYAITPAQTTPAYWKNKNAVTPPDTFSGAANALLPYMGPNEASQTASMLGNTYAKAFGSYLNNSGQAFNGPTPGVYENFLSPGRASQALNTVNTMVKANGTNTASLGPGYGYLNTMLNAEQNLGGGAQGTMGRADYLQLGSLANSLATALKNNQAAQGLKSSAKNKQMLPQWESLAQSFMFPNIPGANTAPVTTNKSGTKTTYGVPSTRLFE